MKLPVSSDGRGESHFGRFPRPGIFPCFFAEKGTVSQPQDAVKQIDRPRTDGFAEESPQGGRGLSEHPDKGGDGNADPAQQEFGHRDPVIRRSLEDVEREKQRRR